MSIYHGEQVTAALALHKRKRKYIYNCLQKLYINIFQPQIQMAEKYVCDYCGRDVLQKELAPIFVCCFSRMPDYCKSCFRGGMQDHYTHSALKGYDEYTLTKKFMSAIAKCVGQKYKNYPNQRHPNI